MHRISDGSKRLRGSGAHFLFMKTEPPCRGQGIAGGICGACGIATIDEFQKGTYGLAAIGTIKRGL